MSEPKLSAQALAAGSNPADELPRVARKPDELIAVDGVFTRSDRPKIHFDPQCRDAGIGFTCA